MAKHRGGSAQEGSGMFGSAIGSLLSPVGRRLAQSVKERTSVEAFAERVEKLRQRQTSTTAAARAEDQAELANALQVLASRLLTAERDLEAAAAIDEAVAIRRALIAVDEQTSAGAAAGLADALSVQARCSLRDGRLTEAAEVASEAVALLPPPTDLASDRPHRHLARLLPDLAKSALEADETGLAADAAGQAITLLRTQSERHKRLGLSLYSMQLPQLAKYLAADGRCDEALAAGAEAVELVRHQRPAPNGSTGNTGRTRNAERSRPEDPNPATLAHALLAYAEITLHCGSQLETGLAASDEGITLLHEMMGPDSHSRPAAAYLESAVQVQADLRARLGS